MLRLIRRLFILGALASIGVLVLRMLQDRDQSWGDGSPVSVPLTSEPEPIREEELGGEVSQELLDILVCPLDKGPLELVDGKWLVNPRNGYRYPIRNGIPVMLIEEGKRFQDDGYIKAETTTS